MVLICYGRIVMQDVFTSCVAASQVNEVRDEVRGHTAQNITYVKNTTSREPGQNQLYFITGEFILLSQQVRR